MQWSRGIYPEERPWSPCSTIDRAADQACSRHAQPRCTGSWCPDLLRCSVWAATCCAVSSRNTGRVMMNEAMAPPIDILRQTRKQKAAKRQYDPIRKLRPHLQAA